MLRHFQNANKCFTKVGLAAGTTTTLTSANAAELAIMGKSYKKAAASNEATPTVDYITGAAFRPVGVSQGCVFTLARDSGGNLRAVQGQILDLNAAGQFILAPQFGPQHNDLAPIGYVVVKVGSTGSAWTFGSSNFAGPPTGVTFGFQDCVDGLPARPQIA